MVAFAHCDGFISRIHHIFFFFALLGLERRTEASNTTCGQEAVVTYVTTRGCGQEAVVTNIVTCGSEDVVTNITALGSEAVVPTLPCLGQKLWC